MFIEVELPIMLPGRDGGTIKLSMESPFVEETALLELVARFGFPLSTSSDIDRCSASDEAGAEALMKDYQPNQYLHRGQ